MIPLIYFLLGLLRVRMYRDERHLRADLAAHDAHRQTPEGWTALAWIETYAPTCDICHAAMTGSFKR